MKNIMYILDLLRDGRKTTNIPGLHVVLMWVILIIKSWQKSIMVFEQQQSTYGKRKRTHNGQYGQFGIWHEYSEQIIDCSDGFESMCEPIAFIMSVG